MLATPVLLIIFNRPDAARKSFEQIRNVQPRQLFIAADGPRPNNSQDVLSCAASREIINLIDWTCEVKTLFRDENRGCGYGPAEAITWFFEHVEQGIILEDDCLAHSSFFAFCEELLQKYKGDDSVSMICGTNPVVDWKIARHSYLFSNMGFSWGWATWREAWQKFDYVASRWATAEGKEKVKSHLKNDALFKHLSSEFEYYFSEVRSDVWDFQWLFCRLYHSSYSIVPAVNLIANIGFDEHSTHTFDINSNYAHLPFSTLKWPLKHPTLKKADTYFDWYVFERFFNPGKRSFAKKAVLKLVKSFVTS
ncbi:hemolytic protein HlpA [Spirosoma daeguense]